MTRVLIVGQDAEQTRSLSQAFAKLRPDVTISRAATGTVATRMMREHSVDIVLACLQMPELDGLELLRWVHDNSPDTAVFTISEQGAAHAREELERAGASESFEKPVNEQEVVERLCDAINQSVRGHLDNVSLASFLQVLEMERKSCTLGVTCGDLEGTLVICKGVLVGARAGDLQGEAAAITVVTWPGPAIAISRRRVDTGVTIKASLGFIVMEAMRLQDEESLRTSTNEASGSTRGAPRRTWRPAHGAPAKAAGVTFESSRPGPGELGLPSGASALALVETSTGNVLRSAARADCPVGDLAMLASQLLLQEAATLRLCGDAEGIEELVLSSTTRCDVIRPLSPNEFALLVFAPEETNLVIARLELDNFIAVEQAARAS